MAHVYILMAAMNSGSAKESVTALPAVPALCFSYTCFFCSCIFECFSNFFLAIETSPFAGHASIKKILREYVASW